jgi:hypothetical protein
VSAAKPKSGFTFVHASVLGALVWLSALAAAMALGEGAWRPGFICGVIAGGIGGVAGFVLLSATIDKSPSVALSARSAGFMFRIMLVGGGLLITIRSLHGEPLAFAFSFFPLFFVFAMLEHLVSVSSQASQKSA